MERSSGILLPISALPSSYGIGTLGKEAYKFIDYLKAAGQRYWQLLPLGPTACGDSPYTALSTFAGNPNYIDLDMLVSDGLLSEDDVKNTDWGDKAEQVDYDKVNASRINVLKKAFSAIDSETEAEIAGFYSDNESWLKSYSLYMALKYHFDMKSWTQWPEDIRKRESGAIEKYTCQLRAEIDFWVFTQFLFYRQWDALREYARDNGIMFIGDIPIYVAMDSADVWAEPKFFQLDADCVPKKVSGVPPDDFCEEGQLWGNPLYDYDAMRSDGFGWWIRRIDGAKRLYDVIRIDHFRGFESYWAVPYGEKSAKAGHWEKGPGMALVGVLTSWFPQTEFIAEDLGYITPEVRRLLDESELPGMKVLEFAFDSEGDSLYLPHNCNTNSVCYVGTHDNNTVLGWVDGLCDADRKFAERYMHVTSDEGWPYGMIRTGMATASKLFVVQMQDVLELDETARMNVPGIALGNWRWRMTNLPSPERLRKITETYRRTN